MPNRETLKQFTKNFKKFAPILQKRVVKNWQDYTEESFADSQEKVPILTGNLERSGEILKARITPQGIESFILYKMPYARTIETGVTDRGTQITLRPVGTEVKVYTSAGGTPGVYRKARKGQTQYLNSSVKSNQPDAIRDIMRSISKAWELI